MTSDKGLAPSSPLASSYIILAQHHIGFHKHGFALVNSLVFAKFMLVAVRPH
jgi:hypothetical protein